MGNCVSSTSSSHQVYSPGSSDAAEPSPAERLAGGIARLTNVTGLGEAQLTFVMDPHRCPPYLRQYYDELVNSWQALLLDAQTYAEIENGYGGQRPLNTVEQTLTAIESNVAQWAQLPAAVEREMTNAVPAGPVAAPGERAQRHRLEAAMVDMPDGPSTWVAVHSPYPPP